MRNLLLLLVSFITLPVLAENAMTDAFERLSLVKQTNVSGILCTTSVVAWMRPSQKLCVQVSVGAKESSFEKTSDSVSSLHLAGCSSIGDVDCVYLIIYTCI